MSSDSTSLHEYEPLKGSKKENSSIFKIVGCILGVMAVGALFLGGMDTTHTTATTNFEEQSLSGQGVANSFGSVQSAEGVQGVENRNCGPMCLMYCEYGFVEVNGCPICRCRTRPSIASAKENDGVLGIENAALENSGKNCWDSCSQKQGKCSWCGSEGYCCRRNWTGNGCDGKIGGADMHSCVNAPALLNAGQNCWSGCSSKQGKCSWCGSEGYCCRKNWTGNGCDGKIGGADMHSCVNPPASTRAISPPPVIKKTILVPTLQWTQSFGGNGGSPFSTQSCFPWGIKRIRIWGGRWVDKVQFQCRNGDWKYPSGGRLQGAVNEFEVPSTEYINGVRVYSGSKIDAIDMRVTGFVTNNQRYLGKIGGSGGNLHTVYGSGDKKELYAFSGRAGDVFDQLKFAFGVTKAFCAVAEEIAGKKCEKLRHDTSAKTSGDCNAACCKDVSCGVWQFDSSNRCWREDSSHQTGMCTKADASVVAGYRLVGDSVKGAVYEGAPKVDPPPLPAGSPPSTAWPACWIDSYGRGVGEPLSTCPKGDEKNGLLCYPACKSGYYGVGPVCWEKCPSGWNDGGVFCNVWMHTVSAEKDCPWYDCCGLTFAKGCTKCPSGYANHGCLCTKPPKHMTKSTYGRTAGKPMICASHLEQNGALCYERCGSSYHGVGPVCWGKCPSSHPHKCGPLMCTTNSDECKGKIGNLAKNIFLKGGIPGLIGIADELCIPKCGDQRHMACTILGKVNDAVSVCPIDITKCPEAFKCLSFLGKRAEEFAKGISKLLSGGALKDFNSFFTGSGGIQGCIKAAGGWFSNQGQGCDVQKDGTFKEFAKCSVPLFKGMFLDDFSSPSLYISIGASGVLGIVGGGTTFDVNFGFDGSIIFSYTKCNTLSTPDLGGGVSVSIGMFGSKNDISGESYVLAAGAGIPGTDIDANAEVVYSSDGERVIAMGANFGVGLGLELAPVSASCSNCDTKLLGCVTTLEEIGLGYLM